MDLPPESSSNHVMESTDLTDYDGEPKRRSCSRRPSKKVNNSVEDSEDALVTHNCGLSTKDALMRLHDDINQEVVRTKDEFSKRPFISWLQESLSFKSELSKMRWPSVVFMTAQAVAHFIVAYVLDVDNVATGWVGFQGFILTILLIFNIAVNLWDTKLRFKELLMKSEKILQVIEQCSQDKQLLNQWKRYNWSSAHAKTLFVPKSPCVHQTLTYRDKSCLNLPDYLLVEGDIIHLYPGERAPGECVRLKNFDDKGIDGEEILQEDEIFHDKHSLKKFAEQEVGQRCSGEIEKDTILFGHAKLKKANKGADFLMLSTPYIKSLRISLQRSHKRPVNSVEKECFIVSRKYFETFVIPAVFILSTIVTAIHYGYLDLTDSDQKIKTISIAYLLLRPSLTIMPFLPWMFPCFWLTVNAYGSARILCCAEVQRAKSREEKISGSDNQAYSPSWAQRTNLSTTTSVPSKFENLLATPTAAGSSENKQDEDELHDLRSDIKFANIFKVFVDLIIGKSGHVWRSSSLLQVLGCLTSLCCIDKVGILSGSNPIPEKVFVLTENKGDDSKFLTPQQHRAGNNNLSDDSNSHHQVDVETSNQQKIISEESNDGIKNLMTNNHEDQVSVNQSCAQTRHPTINQSHAEVLDVSQTSNCYRSSNLDPVLSQQQGRLQFDDLNWRKYLSNLKPLGLTILMNNCCEKSFGDYFRFYKHTSYQSVLRCNLTPVVKRRCLCGLSKLIGFSKDSIENYKYINQIGIYKLIDPTSIKKEKIASSFENATRLKLPFSNMICNIHQDVTTGSYQVFSQGTADIILDACVEFWNGHQLLSLDEVSRKKISDFYHRTSLTSYCSAFSYTPLLDCHKLNDRYIELPPENLKFAPHMRKLANEHQEEFLRNQLISLPKQLSLKSSCNNGSHLSSQENIYDPISCSDRSQAASPLVPRIELSNNFRATSTTTKQITRRHISTEELRNVVDNERSVYKQEKTRQKIGSAKKERKLNDTLDELTDQVFVGMVSMQYQACSDFVALVEQLEHACIRFVHFSKENELRSRVFSEKMGLESGWNCHISLQSDQDLDRADRGGSLVLPAKQNRDTQDISKMGAFVPTIRVSSILVGGDKNATSCDDSVSSDELTLYSWKSLPSLVMQLTAKIIPSVSGNQHNHHSSTTDEANKISRANEGQLNLVTSFRNQSLPNSGPAESDCGDESSRGGDQSGLADNTDEYSIKDEGFTSLAFDMSNRAKLPKGIENIRPHLETVDNVPLQVSLFTDCTPELTKEMIEIMQEYGEIVCVIGSSSSRLNTPIFLQANASIAIEPLLPQSCTRTDGRLQRSLDRKQRKRLSKFEHHKKKFSSKAKRRTSKSHEDELEYIAINMNPRPNNPRDRLGIGPADSSKPARLRQPLKSSSSSSSSSSASSASSSSSSSSSPATSCSSSPPESDCEEENEDRQNDPEAADRSSNSLIRNLPGPSSLASKLASLPCSYSYHRKDQVNLHSLIMEARHFTFKMKNTFVCMICFALSISSAQFLASILFLPPMLSSGLTIWLTVVVVPLQSFSLMSTTIDSQVMKIAVGKNLQLKPENITFFVICYLIKFIPSIIVVVLSFGLIIAHSCKLTGFGSSSLGPCWMFTYVQHGNATTSDTGDEDLLWSTHLLTAQVCAAFLIVLYFGKCPRAAP